MKEKGGGTSQKTCGRERMSGVSDWGRVEESRRRKLRSELTHTTVPVTKSYLQEFVVPLPENEQYKIMKK